MLQLSNQTPFMAELSIMPDKNGVDGVIVVIRATFNVISDGVVVSEDQMPVVRADEYWDAPENSSLKYASEISLPKPATDIVMIGHARSPDNRPVKDLNVGLKVGNTLKVVKVFGDRHWKKTIGMESIEGPKPFVKMPLIYEKAFGGIDVHRSDEKKKEYDPRNPVGSGFVMSGGRKEIDGLKLPNIEDPHHLIKSPQDRPKPAGFGYIAPSWKPRHEYAGTYDKKWGKTKAPFLPDDFEDRFLNCANPDLIASGYLNGNEDVAIRNAGKESQIQFRLPKLDFQVFYIIEEDVLLQTPNLDTLIVEPDEMRFSMIWRAMQPCDKKISKIHTVGLQCISSNIELPGK